jgi:hypothetical protein
MWGGVVPHPTPLIRRKPGPRQAHDRPEALEEMNTKVTKPTKITKNVVAFVTFVSFVLDCVIGLPRSWLSPG